MAGLCRHFVTHTHAHLVGSFLIEHSMKQQELWPSHSSLAISMRELDTKLLVLPFLNLFLQFGTGVGGGGGGVLRHYCAADLIKPWF